MENKKTHYPLIRTIYLYLFALLGLVLLIVGTVRFVDMGLKTFVFTQAEEDERIARLQPPMFYPKERIEELPEEEGLSEEEKARIQQWLVDYQSWKERQEQFDYVAARKQEEASTNLSIILVGLPLYLYHWGIIKKETKNGEKKDK